MSQPQSVVIVGAGQAGQQVAASLRELGFAGAVTIVGGETWLPYQRPPLSKTYLKEDASPERVYLRPEQWYADKSITVRRGVPVAAIDRARRMLRLESGETLGWDHLVLATGVANRRLPVPGADLDGVVGLRGLDDAHDIRGRIHGARRLVIIGGGVIGLEMSALARGLGIEVDIVELGGRLAARVGSVPLSEYFLRFHEALGARVHLSASVAGIEGRDGHVTGARLADGGVLQADMVLVSIGVVANTRLAEAAGLDVRDGILVDGHMATSDPAISAVGDCTRFPPPFGTAPTLRLESVQNAIDQARCAAENIVGNAKPYAALPWFWSDQGTLKLQIAGVTDGHDQTIVKADTASGAMSVYCFAAGRLVGVECINRAVDFVSARRVLGLRKPITPAEVEAADFDLRAFAR